MVAIDVKSTHHFNRLFKKNGPINEVACNCRGLPFAWKPQITLRYAGFMLKGLAETEDSLRSKRIPFHLLRGVEPRGRTRASCRMLPAFFFNIEKVQYQGFRWPLRALPPLMLRPCLTTSAAPTWASRNTALQAPDAALQEKNMQRSCTFLTRR